MPQSLINTLRFRRILIQAILLPFLLMALLAGILVWQIHLLLAATRWVEHTDRVIAQAQEVQKLLADTAALQRSYLLGGNSILLVYLNDSLAPIPSELDDLQRLTADDPGQQRCLQTIRPAYALWANNARREIVLKQQGKSAQNRFDWVQDELLIHIMRAQFATFTRTEELRRRQRVALTQQREQSALGSLFGLALVLGSMLAFTARSQLLGLSRNYTQALQLVHGQAESLRKSEEWLATTLRSIGDGVIATDANGQVTFLNPVAATLTGWTQEEARGRDLQEVFRVVDASTRQEIEGPTARVHREGIAAGQVNPTVLIARDGTALPIDNSGAPIQDAADNLIGTVMVFHDITERKQLEAQLLQAQKMESVGRLAGGVAHDFNNLLTAIFGYAEMAAEHLEANSTPYNCISNLQKAASRAADLTRQLLAFARKQVIEPKIIDLNALVLDIDKILRRLLGEDIELITLSGACLGATKVDPGQFEQILVNLAVNARDAMPEGGKLTIETGNMTLDAEYAAHHADVIPGEYVMLAVSDTGMGMSAEIQRHVFEPFFTTKDPGKGTGLGLATCYGIVKQSGGHIWLYSEPGQGTTFKIYLPRVRKTTETVAAQEILTKKPGGTETILLVEDEPSVRDIALHALREQGYTVLEAVNGVEALQVVRAYNDRIALVVTDVVMPHMGGRELVEQLKATRPECMALYTSGYTDNAVVRHGVLDAGTAFLQKPFTPTTLVRRVREVLDTRTN
jgi:PAS domain S-box-containing protein